jgi:hypothetical protein
MSEINELQILDDLSYAPDVEPVGKSTASIVC